MKAKLKLGMLVTTPGVLRAVASDPAMSAATIIAIYRQERGDWSTPFCVSGAEDSKLNTEAIEHGGRVLSAWKWQDAPKFWVITEADRSVTTVLLPDEY